MMKFAITQRYIFYELKKVLLLISEFIFSFYETSFMSMGYELCLLLICLHVLYEKKRPTSAESSLCFYRIETLQHNYFKQNQLHMYSNNTSRTLCCCFVGFYKRCLYLVILICFLKLLFLIKIKFSGIFLKRRKKQ